MAMTGLVIRWVGAGGGDIWECLGFAGHLFVYISLDLDNFADTKANTVSCTSPPPLIMPRRSSGGRSTRPAPRPAATRNPPPQPANHAPPPAPVQGNTGGSMLGNIGSTIAQGMAFGTGSGVAHRAVDAVMGPRTIQHETVVSEAAAAPVPTATTMGGSDTCSIHSKAFQDCLNSNGNDISKCQFYMDMLAECRRNSGSTISS
ncbi:unnamed protein product [Fraxinus pennsylvanica]|uniref:CHCH domain-containing protein n=1 Tax=Fraxinus pennsylvanica TaxID=56036 RepID=A0AAD1ZIQ9_9LAMI|nr:unnamed protein product [Fraxinus pennsylvanica]